MGWWKERICKYWRYDSMSDEDENPSEKAREKECQFCYAWDEACEYWVWQFLWED